MSYDNLLRPLKLGKQTMKNRLVMPACTRCRAGEGHMPTEAMVKYYADRASYGLVITEGTMIQRGYSTFGEEPGIYSKDQVEAWRKVTDAVHEKGGLLYLQIMHGGRATVPDNLSGSLKVVGPAAVGIKGHPCPTAFVRGGKAQDYPDRVEPLTEEQIQQCVSRFARAARNAMAAGFDGVQIQAGNGFLIDQFINDSCNDRTDQYGGSIENRCRFLFEVVDAVIASIGAHRVGVRISPLDSFLDMTNSDAEGTTHYIAKGLQFRKIAFLEVMRGDSIGPESGADRWVRESYDRILMVNFDVTLEEAERYVATGAAQAVSFGRLGVSNPDLVYRLIRGAPLNEVHAASLFCGGEEGYNDYPMLEAEEAAAAAATAAEEREKNEKKEEEPDSQEESYRHFSAEESMIARSRGNSVSQRRVSFSDKVVEEVAPIEARDTADENNAPQQQEQPSSSSSPAVGDSLLRPLLFPTGTLKNRCIMGSLPRQRCTPDHIPTEAMVKYYADRATAGLLFSEPIEVQPGYHTYVRSSGISTKEQVEGWRRITDAVHEKGGMMYGVLHHGGRVVVESNIEDEKTKVGGPTTQGLEGLECPAVFTKGGQPQPYPHPIRALKKATLEWIVKLYAVAAKNAMVAGFDGVEIEAGSGFLLDSFLRDGGSGEREDEYGGRSVENRARLLLEVIDAVAVIGNEKIGVRLTPLDTTHGMSETDVESLLLYVGRELQQRKISFVEVSLQTNGTYTTTGDNPVVTTALPTLRKVYKGSLFLDEPVNVLNVVEEKVKDKTVDAVVFTVSMVANPDLVERIVRSEAFATVNEETLFTQGEVGYNDYLTLAEIRQKEYEERFEKLEEVQEDQKASAEHSFIRSREPSVTATTTTPPAS